MQLGGGDEMVDEFDLKLVEQLQQNGKKSYMALGKTLGAVEGTIRKRVKNLLKKNIIKIVALPNLSQLGYNCVSITGFQINMKDLVKAAEDLAKKPNVCYLAFVAGRYDLIGIIVTQSPQDLSAFLKNEISNVPGIQKTESFVNMEIAKGGWPLIETAQLISSLSNSSLKKKPTGAKKKISHISRAV